MHPRIRIIRWPRDSLVYKLGQTKNYKQPPCSVIDQRQLHLELCVWMCADRVLYQHKHRKWNGHFPVNCHLCCWWLPSARWVGSFTLSPSASKLRVLGKAAFPWSSPALWTCTRLLSPAGSYLCPPNLGAVHCSHGAPSDCLWLTKTREGIKRKASIFFFEEVQASLTYYYPDLTSQCIFKVRHLPNCMGRPYVGPGSTKPLLIQKWKVWEEITMLFTINCIEESRVGMIAPAHWAGWKRAETIPWEVT